MTQIRLILDEGQEGRWFDLEAAAKSTISLMADDYDTSYTDRLLQTRHGRWVRETIKCHERGRVVTLHAGLTDQAAVLVLLQNNKEIPAALAVTFAQLEY